jgi:CO/xanthine dehydrogenase Mo-binding subunit
MSVTDATASNGTPASHVGRALRGKEDPRLITGQASYVEDINLPGQLWAAWVRSPEAHAKIVSIDTSAAKERPGVRAVYTNEDLDMETGLRWHGFRPASRLRRLITGCSPRTRSSTSATRSRS